ncbi:SLC13 family permease [Streptomyces sp. NPDC051567]|uniref:SLC13 family permease n=1 Tax=Streptomyces sp. NPDC051567 TaxID=3365660 RepID=UPI003798A608
MSAHVIALLALVLVFVIATFSSVHMGVLALVAAFAIGTTVAGESTDDIFGGFPGDLFVVLVGVTFLFAIATSNGTVDWLVHAATRAVRGRIALIPWVMFLITAALTAVGAVVPAAVGVIAPIGMGFAVRYRIRPVLMGLLIINGASAGGFSPVSVFGSITNGVVSRNDLPGSPTLLFAGSFLFNVLLSVVVFLLFGGRQLIGRRAHDIAVPALTDKSPSAAAPEPERGPGPGPGSGPVPVPGPGGTPGPAPAGIAARPGGAPAGRTSTLTAPAGTLPDGTPDGAPAADPVPVVRLDGIRVLTLLGLLSLVVGALFFKLDVGLMALTVTAVLAFASPASAKGAVDRCAWSTVLLVCGVVTFVGLMERMGTIDWLGSSVASIQAPLLGALLICLIGAFVSAFASTTGILGALIPLAVPFLLSGEIGVVGLITALAISSSVVDSSPLSTSGALVTASSPEEERPRVFRNLMIWGLSMAVIAPVTTWMLLIAPGWL